MAMAGAACLEVFDKFLALVLEFFDSVNELESVAVVNWTANRRVKSEKDIRRRVVRDLFAKLDGSPESLREAVKHRGRLLKALVLESNLRPDFYLKVRNLDAWKIPEDLESNPYRYCYRLNDLEFGTHDARIHAPGVRISYEAAAYEKFLDDVVATLVTTPDLILFSAGRAGWEEEPIRVEAGQSTFFFGQAGWIPYGLVTQVVPELAGLTKLEVRLWHDNEMSASVLKLHDLGLDSLRIVQACTRHFDENSSNWRVKELFLDELSITDSRNADLDAVAIRAARQFQFVERVVADIVPDLQDLDATEADLGTVLAALFPIAASKGNLDMRFV